MADETKKKSRPSTPAALAANNRYRRKTYVNISLRIRPELMDAVQEVEKHAGGKSPLSHREFIEAAVRQYDMLHHTEFGKLLDEQ